MSRRAGTENILTAYSAGVANPGGNLLPAVSGIIYAPRKIVLATPGATTSVDLAHASGAPSIFNAQVPVTDTVCVPFPAGLNCPIGSGVDIRVSGGSVNVTLYYVQYDLNPGITKVASRAATYNKQLQLDNQGRKGIRAPNELHLGDKT